MVLIARQYSPEEVKQIIENARIIRERRSALSLRQKDLDAHAGLPERTVQRIERKRFDRRCMAPEDPRIDQVLSTLDALEADVAAGRSIITEAEAPRRMVRRPKRRKSTRQKHSDAFECRAVLKFCPDRSVWITQTGCDGFRDRHPVCRSLRSGRGCRGVKHRSRLETKKVQVEYTPPKPGELDPPVGYGLED